MLGLNRKKRAINITTAKHEKVQQKQNTFKLGLH